MSIRELNAAKRTMRCLKCGKAMMTDRCHRICTKCSHTNEGLVENKASVTPDVRHVLRSIGGNGLGWSLGSLLAAMPVLQED